MASRPGPLTLWPWQKLGNFKYALLAPWVAHSTFKFLTSKSEERDMLSFLIFPVLLLRLLHSQLWITISRYQTARSKHKIVSKSLDFDQVDRERNWDDQIILTALLFYVVNMTVLHASRLPWWKTKGLVITILLHMGPVEFLYYWFHRALHHHFLYSHYHSHHHASIVTEPITSVIHPFAEEVAYFVLFSIPLLTMVGTNTISIAVSVGYLFYIDFMNYLGHCNFEFVPKWLFDIFPPLKYLMYTPSFHSLHHTQLRTNYSLFMPFYDYLYGTLDKSSDDLYERSLHGIEEKPDVVHLTHLTTPQSVFHLPLAFASVASSPFTPKLYLQMTSALTYPMVMLTTLFGRTFISETTRLKKLKIETWVIPRYSYQYMSSANSYAISHLIEKAVLDAEASGAKVLSLGLLNQGDNLNQNGELYITKKPSLKTRIVDGTSMAVAAVLHMIPEGTKDVLLIGNASKITCFLSLVLCQQEIQVEMVQRDSYDFLNLQLKPEMRRYLVLSCSYKSKVWLVGDELTDQDQMKATEGVHFVPYSQSPPKKVRNDCSYHSTPAMIVPKVFENLHACENWLPRRVISAWRTAGIVHALENWDMHECGGQVTGVNKAWSAALNHGFLPFDHAAKN